MPENKKFTSAETLLSDLNGQGLIERHGGMDDYIKSYDEKRGHPVYTQIIVAFGAAIISAMMIAFMYISGTASLGSDFTILGLVFIVAGIITHYLISPRRIFSFIAISILSLTFMATGKLMFLIGMETWMYGKLAGALLLISILVATVYPNSLDSFLSTLAVLVLTGLSILYDRQVPLPREVLFNVFFVLQIGAIGAILSFKHINRHIEPLFYALIVSLCICALFLATSKDFGYWRDKETIEGLLPSLALSGGLIALILWTAGSAAKMQSEPVIVAILGALLIGVVSVPGIVLSLCILVLGYKRQDVFLLVLGGLLMPVFLIYYYYSLHITLLEKSGLLLASGIVLILGSYYIRFRGWDKEQKS